MSHSWEGPNGTKIAYNPDLSEVLLHLSRADAEMVVQDEQVALDGEDLLAFVAAYVRDQRLGALDDMSARAVLGLPERGVAVRQKGAAPYCGSCGGSLDVSDDGAVEPCTECMLARDALVVRCGHCGAELEQLDSEADEMDQVQVQRCPDCDAGWAAEQYAAPMVLFVGDVVQVRRRFHEMGLDAEQVRVDRAGRIVLPATAWIEFYNRAAQEVLDSRLIMTVDKVRLERPKPPNCGHPQTVRLRPGVPEQDDGDEPVGGCCRGGGSHGG